MIEVLISSFFIGLIGNLHCIGMCGPIALILPTKNKTILKILSYNFGRVFTYSLFGLGFGLLGSAIRLVKLQQYASLILGAFIIITISLMLLGNTRLMNNINSKLLSPFSPIKRYFSTQLQKDRRNLFLIGIINGFLPCGLIYIALANSLTAQNLSTTILSMIVFGIATMPSLVTIMIFKSTIIKNVKLNKIIPFMMLFVGILIFMRGMNLGIKYISPSENKTQIENKETSTLGECCKKSD